MRGAAIALVAALLFAGCEENTAPNPKTAEPTADKAQPPANAPGTAVTDALFEALARKYPEDVATIRRLTAETLAKVRAKGLEVDEPRLLKDMAGIPLRKGTSIGYADAIVAYGVLRRERTSHEKTIKHLAGALDPPFNRTHPRDR